MTTGPLVVVAAICWATGPVSAQRVTGAVAGTVTAETGVGLDRVTVTAMNAAIGLRRAATTGPDGRYVILDLPVEGEYEIRTDLAGFAPVVRERVAVVPGKVITIDFVMSVAGAEAVVVTGGGLPGDLTRATLRQTVNEALVHALPLLGRNFIQVASLAAGFTGNPDFPSPQGQSYWTNNVLVDGASHFSKWRGAPRAFYSGFGLEAIREVQVLTNLFSAEFGETLGTVTSAVTRSGTNEWRGNALLFVQDDAFNELPVFATRKPPMSAQQYGFALGGPLVRDRTHVWASYEGRRSRDQNIVVSPAAPNALAPTNQDEHLLFVRVDQSSPRQLVAARYNGQRFRWHDEFGGLALPGTGISYANDVQTALLTDTLQLSDRILSEARVQFARYVDVRQDLQPTLFVSRAGYSLEGGTLGPFGFGADPEDTWEAANTLSSFRGLHALKAGGGFKYVRARNTFLDYGHGAYFFAGPPDRFPQPFLFIQGSIRTAESPVANPRSRSAFGFVQDDWRIRSNLTLNLGVRYDVEDVSNVTLYDVPVDKDNVQPRLGAVWDTRGRGRLIVRGGVGLYTQQHLLYPINRVQLEGPVGTTTVILSPDSRRMPVFPATVQLSSPDLDGPPRDVYLVGATLHNPYSVQTTLGVERTVFGTRVSSDYVYLAGRDLLSLIDGNAPASNPKPALRTVAQADATRPIELGGVYRKLITLGNLGGSWYHALQVKAERSTGRLQTMASYTLSRAEDVDNYQLPEDSRNILADRARAVSDVRHNLAVGFSWELPGERRALNGWRLSGIGMVRSNRPYNVTWGDDRNGTTQNDARPAGRNTGETDAYENVDLSLAKRFRPGRSVIEARVEAFNVLNSTNYDQYVGQLLSPLFASPVSAFPKRRLQLAVTVRF